MDDFTKPIKLTLGGDSTSSGTQTPQSAGTGMNGGNRQVKDFMTDVQKLQNRVTAQKQATAQFGQGVPFDIGMRGMVRGGNNGGGGNFAPWKMKDWMQPQPPLVAGTKGNNTNPGNPPPYALKLQPQMALHPDNLTKSIAGSTNLPQVPPVSFPGVIKLNTDGALTNNIYNDPHLQYTTPGKIDFNGNMVPMRMLDKKHDDSNLDSSSDSFGVVPGGTDTKGMFPIGTKVQYTSPYGSVTTGVGDYGPFPGKNATGFGEMSLPPAIQLGANIVQGYDKYGRPNGPVVTGKDIPVTTTVYPATAPIPEKPTINAPQIKLSPY